MLLTKVLGHLHSEDEDSKKKEWIELDWEELNKRIMRVVTSESREVGIILEEGSSLQPGDILFEDEERIIAVQSKLEDAYLVYPATMEEMGKVAFELGNRHTPCLVGEKEIVVRYDPTLERIFKQTGVRYEKAKHRFKQAFQYKGHHQH